MENKIGDKSDDAIYYKVDRSVRKIRASRVKGL